LCLHMDAKVTVKYNPDISQFTYIYDQQNRLISEMEDSDEDASEYKYVYSASDRYPHTKITTYFNDDIRIVKYKRDDAGNILGFYDDAKWFGSQWVKSGNGHNFIHSADITERYIDGLLDSETSSDRTGRYVRL